MENKTAALTRGRTTRLESEIERKQITKNFIHESERRNEKERIDRVYVVSSVVCA